MGSDKPQINARVTEDQLKAIHEALKAYEVAGKADLIRLALGQLCTRVGIEWPEDMPRWGEHNRQEAK